MPTGHCMHFLLILQDPAGRSLSQEDFSALLMQSVVQTPLCSHSIQRRPPLQHLSVTLIICFPLVGNFSEAERLPSSSFHLQHRAQCVTHSGHAIITTDGQSFQWEASVETVWPADTDAIQRLQLFEISCLLACLVPLSKKLAHP